MRRHHDIFIQYTLPKITINLNVKADTGCIFNKIKRLSLQQPSKLVFTSFRLYTDEHKHVIKNYQISTNNKLYLGSVFVTSVYSYAVLIDMINAAIKTMHTVLPMKATALIKDKWIKP